VPCFRCVDKGVTCQPRYKLRTGDSSRRKIHHASGYGLSPRIDVNNGSQEIDHQKANDRQPPHSLAVNDDSRLSETFDDGSTGMANVMDTSQVDFSVDGNNPFFPDSPFFANFVGYTGQPLPSAALSNFGEFVDLGSTSLVARFPVPSEQQTQKNQILSPREGSASEFSYPNAIPDNTLCKPVPASMSGLFSTDRSESTTPHRISVPQRLTDNSSRCSSRSTFAGRRMADVTSGVLIKAVPISHDGWSWFRCNPTTQRLSSQVTPGIYLEGLSQVLAFQKLESLAAWSIAPESDCLSLGSSIKVGPTSSSSREKLLVFGNCILHRAFKVHRTSLGGFANNIQPRDYLDEDKIIVLPNSQVQDSFLRAYTHRFEQYYPLLAGGRLSPDDFMRSNNVKTHTILLLSMISLGSMATSSAEATYLSYGLAEACRVSLNEMSFEKKSDPINLRSALMLTIQGAWSGDKYYMDVSTGTNRILHQLDLCRWP